MFDSLVGFLAEDKLSDNKKHLRDVYVWLLNMASLYKDCCAENTFNNLDFLAHYFLQKKKMNIGSSNLAMRVLSGRKQKIWNWLHTMLLYLLNFSGFASGF